LPQPVSCAPMMRGEWQKRYNPTSEATTVIWTSDSNSDRHIITMCGLA